MIGNELRVCGMWQKAEKENIFVLKITKDSKYKVRDVRFRKHNNALRLRTCGE